MKRYIDADELKKKSFDLYDGRQNGTFMVVKESDIDDAPTVDAIQVVQCKDCTLRHSSEYCECRPDDFYCGDGERKDVDNV